MLPINPLPPFKAVRPLLMIGLAAGATALALWARRHVAGPAVRKAVRVEPFERLETVVVDVPWGSHDTRRAIHAREE